MEHGIYKYLDIDTKRILGIPPGKIDESKAWRLWYLLDSHDGMIYNLESQSLHSFRNGMHVIRRPIELTYMDKWTCVFNVDNLPHNLEITEPGGVYVVSPDHTETIYTECRVLLRGSGLARVINYTGTTR